ncbi:tetratricopeptide repeat protein [Caenimonas aquaedulcis]|uniref:protein O-GlcNAc transferase n=1 Tax=Caenimonas aquaedulcis TaxID=2793270 RepID=A0A931H438_9BURK|nr:glycosyltransferase family 41 protein [Caenimonas aquaedulcis]MBG9388251.1 tetratricopeptide repeat protein [Caenimonas aquaedulcis]
MVQPDPVAPQSLPRGAAAQLAQLHREGRHADLEAATRRLVAAHPKEGFLWKALGVACAALGKPQEALEAKRRAVQLLPRDGEARYNLANALVQAGQLEEAIACIEQAVPLLREPADALNHLGNLLRDAHRMPEARRRYEEAISHRPDFAEAHSNLGNTLSDLGDVSGAERHYLRALALQPNRGAIHSNLGNLLKEQGRHAEAQAAYRSAVELDPGFAGARSNLLLALNHDPSVTPSDFKAAAMAFGRFASKRARGIPFTVQGEVPARRPLRVGFVSGDLRQHPVGYFLEGLLEHLDPAEVTAYAYPTVMRRDSLSDSMRPYFAQWREIARLDDEAAARLIHADGIDVLIDLAGHTAYNRLCVFAYRPAPIQATWLGYFATTGVEQMDWLLADAASIAPGEETHYTERIGLLPRTRLCFRPPGDAPPVAALPALANGHITFGSFQNLGKIGDAVLAAWSRAMRAVPGSHLRLQNGQLGDAGAREQLMRRLRAAGIDDGRVAMHGRTSRLAYLRAHSKVDMILDTFPYPGGTTTCEALWMGVPTLTLAGDRMLSRQGASLLHAAGLDGWIAKDEGDYLQKAQAFCSDIHALAKLRGGLRERVAGTPLFDAALFARDFTQALREMALAR